MSKRIPQPTRFGNMNFDPRYNTEIPLVCKSWRPPHEIEHEMKVNLVTLVASCTCVGFSTVMVPRGRELGERPNLANDNLCCRHLKAARDWLIERGYLSSNNAQLIAAGLIERQVDTPAFQDEDPLCLNGIARDWVVTARLEPQLPPMQPAETNPYAKYFTKGRR